MVTTKKTTRSKAKKVKAKKDSAKQSKKIKSIAGITAAEKAVLLKYKKTLFSPQNLLKGVKCLCCTQHVKLYKRKINAQMCYYLIKLAKLTKHTQVGQKYFSVKQIGLDYNLGGDWARLRHWGLIEEMPNYEDAKRTSGHWAITKKGKKFVNMKLSVPEKLLINNNTVHGFEGDNVNLQQALKNKFNYKQLMEAYN